MERINLEQLQKCFDIQKEFDERVFTRIGRVSTKEEREDALLVELAEWYNTLEIHKYWKETKGKPLEVQLDEAADCMAFMFSWLLEVECDIKLFYESVLNCIPYHLTTSLNLTKLFNCKKAYILNIFLSLYGWEDLYAAYEKKMVVNHERQDSGY